MNEKELRKISRKELLELLLEQANRIVDLENELTKIKAKLEDKKIMLNEAGNLAEASLKITDLFQKTMETCKIYSDNIDELNSRIEKEVRKKYEEIEKQRIAELESTYKNNVISANNSKRDKAKIKYIKSLILIITQNAVKVKHKNRLDKLSGKK